MKNWYKFLSDVSWLAASLRSLRDVTQTCSVSQTDALRMRLNTVLLTCLSSKIPPTPLKKGRVVSYKQRKTKTEFQSLSPRGGEVWREGKSHATFTINQDLCIFIFSYETTLPTPLKKGGFEPSFTPFLRGSPQAGGS